MFFYISVGSEGAVRNIEMKGERGNSGARGREIGGRSFFPWVLPLATITLLGARVFLSHSDTCYQNRDEDKEGN